jgi:hypothetical protein
VTKYKAAAEIANREPRSTLYPMSQSPFLRSGMMPGYALGYAL